jgi:hypothetical protein
MKYTGNYNTRCPLCSHPFSVEWHPVVLKLDNVEHKGMRVCPDCFKKWVKEFGKLRTENSLLLFEEWLTARLEGTPFACPSDYVMKGFWFGTFERGPLGLVINYILQ